MCKFDIAWVGFCKEPGEPFCMKHAQMRCTVCKEQATKECPTAGSFVCGAPLCDTCSHHCGYRPAPKEPEQSPTELPEPFVFKKCPYCETTRRLWHVENVLICSDCLYKAIRRTTDAG